MLPSKQVNLGSTAFEARNSYFSNKWFQTQPADIGNDMSAYGKLSGLAHVVFEQGHVLIRSCSGGRLLCVGRCRLAWLGRRWVSLRRCLRW